MIGKVRTGIPSAQRINLYEGNPVAPSASRPMTADEHTKYFGKDSTMNDENWNCFGVVCERPGQDPILMEAEGERTSEDGAREAAKRFGSTRYCIVRLVPVEGNMLLLKDMERLQK